MSDSVSSVYVVSAEVRPLEGSQMWGQAVGGFVDCFALAADAREAARRVEQALEEDLYDVASFDWIMPEEKVDWSDDDAEQEKANAEEARNTREVVYSVFLAYESED